MRLGMLFSGGKDSVYACHRAQAHHEVACLLTLSPKNTESYMFHTPNIRHTPVMAEVMGIPHVMWPTSGIEEEELSDLDGAIAWCAGEYGLDGIVTGAIASVYQATRVQRICHAQGLWCFNPLWQADQVAYLRALVNEGFDVIISGVFAYPLDEAWLGRRLDSAAVDRLVELRSRYGINPSGEGGELETFVLDAPCYRAPLVVEEASRTYHAYAGVYRIDRLGVGTR